MTEQYRKYVKKSFAVDVSNIDLETALKLTGAEKEEFLSCKYHVYHNLDGYYTTETITSTINEEDGLYFWIEGNDVPLLCVGGYVPLSDLEKQIEQQEKLKAHYAKERSESRLLEELAKKKGYKLVKE